MSPPASAPALDAAPRASTERRALALPTVLVLGVLCTGFFVLELIYCRHLPLVMDELQGASAVYNLRGHVPYVDFMPYKNVLGYYVQLPFMLLYKDLWSQMLAIKLGTAAITALGIFWSACMLARQIRGDAVVLATCALFAMSTFLERAAELRVDMLTGLAGLISFVLLLSRRYALAGLACGLSFLISQKGIYYFVGSVVALGGRGVMLGREHIRWREGAVFGAVALGVIGLYMLTFGTMGSFEAVTGLAFAKSAQIALADDYKHLARFWIMSVQRNPYFYALGALGIGAAYEAARRDRTELDWMIFAYGGSVLMLCVGHKQPWPYFFVLLIPTLWVTSAYVIDRMAPRGATFWVLFLLVGLLFPLYTRIPIVLARENDSQRYAITLASRMLRKHDTYLAGIDMIYTREQSPKSIAWLDKPSLDVIHKTPIGTLTTDLEAHPPKLVIGNYRVDSLPSLIRRALRSDYEHFWSSVWLYAPIVRSPQFPIAWSGDYSLVAEGPVLIDRQLIQPGQFVHLLRGTHLASTTGFRLRLAASKKIVDSLDPKYRNPPDLFPAVYDY
jgi:hypothetical protein